MWSTYHCTTLEEISTCLRVSTLDATSFLRASYSACAARQASWVDFASSFMAVLNAAIFCSWTTMALLCAWWQRHKRCSSSPSLPWPCPRHHAAPCHIWAQTCGCPCHPRWSPEGRFSWTSHHREPSWQTSYQHQPSLPHAWSGNRHA